MADREKVIEGLKRCLHFDGTCNDCPYDGPNCQNDVLDDALALLKEQPEVVRCKDCKYMERLPWLDDEDFKAMVCRKHTYTGMRKEDFFCADGERKTNDT